MAEIENLQEAALTSQDSEFNSFTADIDTVEQTDTNRSADSAGKGEHACGAPIKVSTIGPCGPIFDKLNELVSSIGIKDMLSFTNSNPTEDERVIVYGIMCLIDGIENKEKCMGAANKSGKPNCDWVNAQDILKRPGLFLNTMRRFPYVVARKQFPDCNFQFAMEYIGDARYKGLHEVSEKLHAWSINAINYYTFASKKSCGPIGASQSREQDVKSRIPVVRSIRGVSKIAASQPNDRQIGNIPKVASKIPKSSNSNTSPKNASRVNDVSQPNVTNQPKANMKPRSSNESTGRPATRNVRSAPKRAPMTPGKDQSPNKSKDSEPAPVSFPKDSPAFKTPTKTNLTDPLSIKAIPEGKVLARSSSERNITPTPIKEANTCQAYLDDLEICDEFASRTRDSALSHQNEMEMLKRQIQSLQSQLTKKDIDDVRFRKKVAAEAKATEEMELMDHRHKVHKDMKEAEIERLRHATEQEIIDSKTFQEFKRDCKKIQAEATKQRAHEDYQYSKEYADWNQENESQRQQQEKAEIHSQKTDTYNHLKNHKQQARKQERIDMNSSRDHERILKQGHERRELEKLRKQLKESMQITDRMNQTQQLTSERISTVFL